MKYVAFVLLLCTSWGGPACAQTPESLVVGAVRDTRGAPIGGAQITFLDSAGNVVGSARTDYDGTFAREAPSATEVRIACDYCMQSEWALVRGQPVLAIVRRFDAVAQSGPSTIDAGALPYARVESLVSLTPFVVLSDSAQLLPGPSVSDRGLSRAGGLLIDRGVPNYDFAANVSPFLTTASRSSTDVSSQDARTAFLYGDRADAGSFYIAPAQGPSNAAIATAGESLGRVHLMEPPDDFDFAVSGNAAGRRERFDAHTATQLGAATLDASVSMSDSTSAPSGAAFLNASFAAAKISLQMMREQLRYADVVIDHGTYAALEPASAIGAQWSDFAVRAGMQTLGSTNVFLEVGARRSNGYYAADPFIYALSGALDQLRFSAGLRSHAVRSDLLAGFSVFDVAYSGGPGAVIFSPSIAYTYRADAHWSLDGLAASTFRLPTLVERFERPGDRSSLLFDRNALVQATLSYQDLARVRASITAYRQNTSGLDAGTVSGAGASLAWQISPQVSLRSWFLHDSDATVPVGFFSSAPLVFVDAGVGSGWLTYDTGAFRADVIYRRDLLGGAGYSHLDYGVSSALSPHVGWFAGSEVRRGERSLSAGIRFVP